MSLPERKPGTLESVGAYVLRRLVDAGQPVPSNELHIGRPDHISESSPSSMASKLYTMGVLGRTLMEPNGQKDIRYRYHIADLDKLPPDFVWEFRYTSVHHGPREHTKPRSPSEIFNHADNDKEEPVGTHPNKAADYGLGQGALGHEGTMHPSTTPAAPTAHAPDLPKPGVVVVFGGRARQLSVADARAVYAQLKDLFG